MPHYIKGVYMLKNIALSAFTAGFLVFTGCGSDSGDGNNSSSSSVSSSSEMAQSSVSSNNSEASSSSEATAEAPKFTTEMLAGKTLHVYGTDTEGRFGDSLIQIVINADATALTIKSPDGTETYLTDHPMSINKYGTFSFDIPEQFGGGTESYALIKVDNGLYLTSQPTDLYPRLFSETDLGEQGGIPEFEQMLAEYETTMELLTSHPWYQLQIEITDEDDDRTYTALCGSKQTFSTDGTVVMEYVSDGVDSSQTSSFELNDLGAIMGTDEMILLAQQTVMYKTKEQVQATIEAFGLDATDCLTNYPAE